MSGRAVDAFDHQRVGARSVEAVISFSIDQWHTRQEPRYEGHHVGPATAGGREVGQAGEGDMSGRLSLLTPSQPLG